MSVNGHSSTSDKITAAGALAAVGIVFGDIGTSPLYTFPAVMRGQASSELLALGTLSAILWTLTLQTTIKYVIITMRADNRGEGGIFSLYALVRRYRGWLLVPAILGGSFLLADSIITPPISVASAVEGLLIYYPHLNTVPIVLAILVGLFWAQQLGTQKIGAAFGVIMMIWFTFIGVMGLIGLAQAPEVLKAVNPWYAIRMLTQHPGGFWLLGGVFLCTTGAEALYSDMGHVGRANIRLSWAYIKVCLFASYAGQSGFLLMHPGYQVAELTPFLAIVPEALRPFSITISTLATIIASQALISGSFTLIGEAMRLGLWPRLRIVYPTDMQGQLYIPAVNWLLCAGCVGVVLRFRESANMEAAFGLSVTLTMLMSTVLVSFYMRLTKVNPVFVWASTALFLTVELCFLVANLKKFAQGGYITLMLGLMLVWVMYVWHRARQLKRGLADMQPLAEQLPSLNRLSNDAAIPRLTTNLIFLTAAPTPDSIERRTLYSIFSRGPKRADLYWFIHIETLDEPFAMRYQSTVLAEQDVVWVTFQLGFRIEPRINLMLRRVVEQMVAAGEIDITSPYPSLGAEGRAGDFRFVLFSSFLSYENHLPAKDLLVMNTYFALRRLAQDDASAYGLDTSQVTLERVALLTTSTQYMRMERIATGKKRIPVLEHDALEDSSL